MKSKIILFLLLLPLFRVQAQAPDAKTIMDESRELTLTGSLSATITLTITEKNGMVRNRTISILSKSSNEGTERRLIRFLEPADVRGTSLLINDYETEADEMWIYLPALKKTRRIVSSERGKSFMSSEFTNADMSSPSQADFESRHLPESGKNNLWIIESTPVGEEKADEYGFSRKISYISADRKVIRKMEFFNSEDRLFKIIEINAVQPGVSGRYIVSHMTARNLVNGRSSEIRFSSIKMNAGINDSEFTLQNLAR